MERVMRNCDYIEVSGKSVDRGWTWAVCLYVGLGYEISRDGNTVLDLMLSGF